MNKELPGEWGTRLGPKGIHSYRDLAAAVGSGVSQGTMHRLVTGKATSAETVNKVADALFDGDRDLVWRLRGSRRRDYGDWSLPADASLLNEEQREAVLSVIRAMVPAEHEELMGNADQHPAATNAPDSGPGTVTSIEQNKPRLAGRTMPAAASKIESEPSVSKRRRRQDEAIQENQDPGDNEPR